MSSVFGVGIATVDIINSVNDYPQEDSEIRAISQRISRGGNVCNTLTVLSQLEHHCYWCGVISEESDSHYILDDLKKNKIDLSFVQSIHDGKVPTSYITLNQKNGSRSIVHYRDLPELSYLFFQSLHLPQCDWFHFEARAIDETIQMIKFVRSRRPSATISVEIEKQREALERILGVADVYLFSKAYAVQSGFQSPEKFLMHQHAQSTNADLVCSWGEKGATAFLSNGELIHSKAFPPEKVIDTLGAGDTFNAGIIHSRLTGFDWQQGLELACQLAGKKCGQFGFQNLN